MSLKCQPIKAQINWAGLVGTHTTEHGMKWNSVVESVHWRIYISIYS